MGGGDIEVEVSGDGSDRGGSGVVGYGDENGGCGRDGNGGSCGNG